MGVIDFAEYLNQAISAGSAIEGTAVKIIADNGREIGDAVFKVIEGGNGTASEVGVATQTAAGGGLVATGLAYLALDVGTVGLAIAPALGIAAGYGLYNLTPDFWDGVANALITAGETVGGKVLAYWDGDNIYFSQQTIETIKNAFLDHGVFEGRPEIPEYKNTGSTAVTSHLNGLQLYQLAASQSNMQITWDATAWTNFLTYLVDVQDFVPFITMAINSSEHPAGSGPLLAFFKPSSNNINLGQGGQYDEVYSIGWRTQADGQNHVDVLECYFSSGRPGWWSQWFEGQYIFESNNYRMSGLNGDWENQNLQPDAIYPSYIPFPETYPNWPEFTPDPSLPDPSEMPTIYPVKYPGIGDDPYPTQDPAQDPDPEPVPEVYPVILPDFIIPEPGTVTPVEPTPDPDPQPEPDPIPQEGDPTVTDDPVDPNPSPDPSLPIVIPPLPDTTSSSKLFTVYNPTSSQLDALGGYLWDASIIAAIRDIWQEPMDGLISLQQVFVTPQTGGNHNIILGFLDSGVSSAVVSDQFVTVDCGTVSVPENKNNATDYAPYTSLHLYLPFIGIVELDTNECMNADITVTYNVDVYTGTCLAQISVDRDEDMPNDPILYTFSGNCSQQLPLTSGNATGVLSALVGAISTGISVASGGGLSTLAGAQLLGNSLTHEMMHVSHSGNISANAGIMGQKKPYLIIGRRHGYDANNYNRYYGFPANKTVILGNHTGFARMKSGYVKTSATKQEYEEIMRLLEEGVFL